MELSAKWVRSQLQLLKPLMAACSLETARHCQDKLGELMTALHRSEVLTKPHAFSQFSGAWLIPKDERRQGVLLYLHGGGYTCGDLNYAQGFASTLAAECGMRVFCIAYRLAPEHPFPAALEDALEAYQYLLRKGYRPGEVALCGESAGGGLCYALCLRLKERNLPLPAGIVAVSPWTDLTASGDSYETNREADPCMSAQALEFYAACYTDCRENPLVSPLFGDLKGLPPSLLFVGGDEILLDDTRRLHRKLQSCGCQSQMVVAPERWHVYVLYGLKENRQDLDTLRRFLTRCLGPERKLRWMRLDNAAKIYPAALRRSWSNVFRLSATLTEPIDPAVMQSALDVTARRFPSMAVRLRRGVFWYYLEQVPQAPAIREELSCPLAPMRRAEIRRCAFRVIVYQNRVAVEFFHALTDGNGGLIFLKTLLAEYFLQKEGLRIPAENGVLGRLEEPSEAELEDSFLKYAGPVSAGRKERTAWHPAGTPVEGGFRNLICFRIPVEPLRRCAKQYGVSVTEVLCAAMLRSLALLQQRQVPNPRRRKPLKVLLPVNLRRLFPSRTLRNFVLYTTPEIDPRLGEYTFPELCSLVHHHMALEVTPKQMSRRITANVHSEQALILKIMPLFVKNAAMKAVFNVVGERTSCLCMSNLGVAVLPEALRRKVVRMDFIIGPQASAPNNCGMVTFGDTLYCNFIRNIQEPELEQAFHQVLRELGLQPTVESNLP